MNTLVRAIPWLLATVLLAALTHFIAILILPRVATRDAFHRIASVAHGAGTIALPRPEPGSATVPFQDPAAVQGVCFFDLTKAPVRVKTSVEEGRLLTLSFRTPEGRIFYAMTDRAALRGTIDIRVVTEAQLREIEATDEEDQGLPTELRLKSPADQGMMIATALAARPGDGDGAEALIKAIECRPEPIRLP